MNFLQNVVFALWVLSGISCSQTSNTTDLRTNHSDTILQKRFSYFNEKVYPALAASVQTGYLITRMGCDITSQLLSRFNKKDASFSHCGIVIIEKDTPFVYHCIGGEFNPDQKMKRENLFEFSSPLDAKKIGIFQPDITSLENERLVKIIHAWHKAGLPFDLDFSLETDQKMYCSEMVSKAYEKATNSGCRIAKRKIEHFEFIPIENTFNNPWMKEKLRMNY